MAIRNIINNGKGNIRKGWEKFRYQDLNDKERAEGAYTEKMSEKKHFLSYKGLMDEGMVD
jgi:hypothetical protein